MLKNQKPYFSSDCIKSGPKIKLVFKLQKKICLLSDIFPNLKQIDILSF